jgi:carbonic anhydrase
MQLFEAIVEANHRAINGSRDAGIRLSEFRNSLPIAALTCIDPRLDPLLPEVLGVPPELFIWLRNAGNIITGPLSSTMRSLALACAVKGGREIAILGHTECRVRQTTVMALTEAFRKMGVDRSRLPENMTEFFGLFASERQNVIKACDIVRASPLVGPNIPVHGLMVDIHSGLLEWVVNGYQTLGAPSLAPSLSDTQRIPIGGATLDSLISKAADKIGNMEVHTMKIGEIARRIEPLVHEVAKTAPQQTQKKGTQQPARKQGAPPVLRPIK